MLTITVLKNPFNNAQKDVYLVDHIPEKTVGQYVQPYLMGLEEIVCSVNGKIVDADFIPRVNDYIAVCAVVGKGNIFGTLLSIALMVYAPGWGANLAGVAAGTTSALAGLYAGAIMYIGGSLIGHLFPQPAAETSNMTSSTPTYGWGNLQAQTSQGGALPRTYGTMRTAGIEIAKHVTTDGDKQYLNLLLCGGEGLVDSISDIMINDNPIENYTNPPAVDIRLGTNDQTVIPNFNDTYADQSLSFLLGDNVWSTQQTEGNAGSGLEVTVNFPNGLYHTNDDGSLGNASVTLAAQYRVENGTWIPWLGGAYVSSSSIPGATCYPTAATQTWIIDVMQDSDNNIYAVMNNSYISIGNFDNGKIKCVVPAVVGRYTICVVNSAQITAAQNTAVLRRYRIDNLPPARYEVRMMVTARSAASNSVRDNTKCYWSQLSHISYDDFCRPGKVLIGIKALATDQLSGSDISVTWKQTVENVNVLNPNTGQYELQSARNPAWVAYDILHSSKFLKNIQLGTYQYVVQNVPANRIDYQAFATWAAHCDVLGLQFEHIFDAATDLWTALKTPETFGRGKVIMQGTKFSCICDKPSTPVQMFTVGNIDQDKFSKDYLSITDRANAIEITFVNKDKDYQKDAITVYGDDWNSSTQLKNPTQITLNGCTSYQQAYAYGMYLLRVNKYLLRTCKWNADIDAIACQIGDQVLVQHDVPQWGYGGRITAATANTITLDCTVIMVAGKTYSVIVRLQDDSFITKAVVNTNTNTKIITVTTPFTILPQQYDLFTFGEVTKEAKPFIIIDVERVDDLSCSLTGIEYVPAVYEESLNAPVIQYSPVNTLAEITGLNINQETYQQKDGTSISVINCSWAIPKGKLVKEFKVYYSKNNGSSWQSWGSTIQSNNTIMGVKPLETYVIKVCTINEIGIVSPGVISDPIYITGKDQPPSDVPSLTATIDPTDSTKINLSWPAVTDIDLRGYRVMEGSTVLTLTPITDTRYTYTASSSRQYTFSVIAIDNSGNPSVTPATKVINIIVEPATVAGFSIAPLEADRSRLRMQWNANSESDISYYEIRVGANGWDTASIVATQLKATLFEYTLANAGSITYMIKAVNVSGKYSTNAAAVTQQYTLTPNAPASGSIVQDVNDRTFLIISWSPIIDKDLSQYEIRLGINWDTGVVITATKETTIRYKISASGSYKIMVKSKNVAGYYSTALNLSIPASVEAMDVTGFAAVQSISDHSRVTLSWNQPSALDVAYFEIRKGVTWDTGIIVGKRVTGTYYDVIVTDETAQTYWIKAVNVGGVYSQNPVSVMGIYNLNPSMPTNLVITQNPNDRSQLVIKWDSIPELDLNEYQLKVGYTWETGDYVAKTKELIATYNPPVSGDYKFMLKAKNNSDFYSDEVFTHFYATLEPSDVTSFQASQNGESVLLTWTKVSDADVVGYEIREGSTFDNGSVIQTGITMAMYQFAVDTEITRKFHIKAINRSGRYSQTEAMASVTITNLLPKNVISTYDEIALQSGTHSNTEFGQSLLTFATLTGKFSDYPTTKFSDIGGVSVLKLSKKVDPSFTRSSIAYKSDGTQVVSGAPRFENGGLTVEEGTTNLTIKDFSNNTGVKSDGTTTVTVETINTFVGRCIKSVYTSGTNDIYIQGSSYFIQTLSTVFSVTFFIKRVDGQPITATSVTASIYASNNSNLSGTGVVVALTNGWYKVTLTRTLGTSGAVNLIGLYFPDNNSYYVDGWQIEAKAYPTSYTPNTRSAESVTGNTLSTVLPNQGTLELTCNVTPAHILAATTYYLFTVRNPSGNGEIGLRIVSGATGKCQLVTRDDNNVVTSALTINSLSLGQHTLAISWSPSLAKLYVDGVLNASISLPKLPSSLANIFYVGNQNGIFQANTQISNFCISNTARTDSEIANRAANGIILDNFTTCLLNFNNSMIMYNPSGIYTCARKDMDSVITANIATIFQPSILFTAGTTATLQFRTSQDNSIWTDWTNFAPIQATFRYVDFRVVLATSDTTKTPEVNALMIRVDVPDYQSRKTATVSIGGTDINYGHTYYQQAFPLPTAIGQGLRAELISYTLTSAKVRVVNTAGTDVGGQIILDYTGY